MFFTPIPNCQVKTTDGYETNCQNKMCKFKSVNLIVTMCFKVVIIIFKRKTVV